MQPHRSVIVQQADSYNDQMNMNYTSYVVEIVDGDKMYLDKGFHESCNYEDQQGKLDSTSHRGSKREAGWFVEKSHPYPQPQKIEI